MECRNILSPHLKDKAIYRLTEPDAERYKQAVLFGVRRSAAEKNRLSDQAVNQANWKLARIDAYDMKRSRRCRTKRIVRMPYRKAGRCEWNTGDSRWTWWKIC